MSNEWMQELRLPFHPAMVSFKPGVVKGKRALALAYADLRAYMNRLDEVCGADWSVQYQPWGDDKIICNLTIAGVTRSSVGETTNEADRNDIGGMVAEAQAMKRACAMFGLGRYLYNLPTIWADFDPETKQFTQHAKAKLTGTLVQHYRRVTGINPGDGTADYEASRAAETPQTAQDSDKAPRRAQTPQRPQNGAQRPVATPDVSADELFEKPRGDITPDTLKRLNTLGSELYGKEWDAKRHELVEHATGGETKSSKELFEKEAGILIRGMAQKRAKQAQKEATPA